MITIIII